MGKTMIEKIIGNHADCEVNPGDIVDVKIDARIARDFGGANVVKNIKDKGLSIEDPEKTFFTFDCNPGGSDPKYAANQQTCRVFAREQGIDIFDINSGVGTHIAIDKGLITPGGTLVSTDSHANILGAIGAFGQGMGDKDIASVWANGAIWFKVPPTIKVEFVGKPSEEASPKDLILAALKELGAAGLLEHAAEFTGEAINELNLSCRITMASMCTEAGGIIALFPPNDSVIEYCKKRHRGDFTPVYADDDAVYAKTVKVNIEGLLPQCAKPGHPDDVTDVASVKGQKIDSAFIGSCTNGRYEDMVAAAEVLEGKKVAPGVVLKIVPSTDEVWKMCLEDGILDVFKKAGALVGNAGCAGCASGQIGQNGPGEITISTGNRNFPGKQGKGSVYLASPATVAASAVAGQITTAALMPEKPALFKDSSDARAEQKKIADSATTAKASGRKEDKKTKFKGRVWAINIDNVDTDMIFHNMHLAITELSEMGQHTFGNLDGYKDFPEKVKAGDIVFIGSNFGCGSSRQQAVDCFKALGVELIVADSYGAIYERNAINAAFPIVTADWHSLGLETGDEAEVDMVEGTIVNCKTGKKVTGRKAAKVQLEIYNRGGLL